VLLSSGQRAKIEAAVAPLQAAIEQCVDVVLVDFDGAADLTTIDADMAIVFGGDGAILRAARQMGRRQLPVLGVNMGKLGFLADLAPDELLPVLPLVCQGKAREVDHLMLHCQVRRGEKIVAESLALNEIAILSGPPFAILEVNLYVDAELATTYSCDGLIVSTPVGSTAHSLSAGGPILRKSLQAVVICPISPHTLTNRPVVDTADRVYELEAPRPHGETSVVVDGQTLCRLTASDRARIVRSEACFRLIEVPGHGYYRTLREKLGWGGGLIKTSS
jgi:NAD+ kinase